MYVIYILDEGPWSHLESVYALMGGLLRTLWHVEVENEIHHLTSSNTRYFHFICLKALWSVTAIL